MSGIVICWFQSTRASLEHASKCIPLPQSERVCRIANELPLSGLLALSTLDLRPAKGKAYVQTCCVEVSGSCSARQTAARGGDK